MLPGLLERIERGEAKPGSEDAYVRTSARNRARDHFREQSGVRSRASIGDDPDEIATPWAGAEQLLLEREDTRERAVALARIRYLITQAPEAYRQVLEHVHVACRPIEELVTMEMTKRGADASDAVERRRARAAVDKTLQRAREWVRANINPARKQGAAAGTKGTSSAPRGPA
jgi:DNA-directed RNA polymerase specialized sigma24 family protein